MTKRLGVILGVFVCFLLQFNATLCNTNLIYAIVNRVFSGPGRIRTYDQWIMSPLLYR